MPLLLKRARLIASLTVVVSIFCVQCAQEPPCQDSSLTNCAVNENTFEKITIGMPNTEALALVGEVNKVALNPRFPKEWDSGARWVRHAQTGNPFIALDLFFLNGKVVDKNITHNK